MMQFIFQKKSNHPIWGSNPGPLDLKSNSQSTALIQYSKYLKSNSVSCGVRTHAHSRVSELKSDALDHSAKLTLVI